MITRADIVGRVREWGLREDVVEKDYVLGWVLWGIGADTELETRWAFKGGTCLRKCYIETYRFSEDLDFTVLPGKPMTETVVSAALARVMARVGEASGIDFSARPLALRTRPDGASLEGRIFYRGPRAAPGEASIKIDLSLAETMARPTVLRQISHPYPDALPDPASVRCYSFDELFAEKLRAMAERGRPRDLYDIINLYWRGDLRPHGPLIQEGPRREVPDEGRARADAVRAGKCRHSRRSRVRVVEHARPPATGTPTIRELLARDGGSVRMARWSRWREPSRGHGRWEQRRRELEPASNGVDLGHGRGPGADQVRRVQSPLRGDWLPGFSPRH